MNRLGLRGETRHGRDVGAYARRIGAFGWHTIEIDGHDIEAIDAAYTEALQGRAAPTAILARTMKDRGVAAVSDAEGAHGTARPDVVVLDGEVSDSTKTDEFARRHPDRFFEMFIAEQQMAAAALGMQARADTGCFVTVEDHWAEGGLGDAVLAAFANGHQAPRTTNLAAHAMPGSATPGEQLHAAGIDAQAIEAAARRLAADRVASG